MQSSRNSVIIHTAVKPDSIPAAAAENAQTRTKSEKAGFGEKLLRNTAVACALLLGILTLKNIDAPWSQAAVSGIESALTMRIDPDESLGKLSFVRSIVPESALVFLNISGKGCVEPVEGDAVHSFSEGQPWTVYQCAEKAPVRSAMTGNVSAVTQLDTGDWCVVIDHGGGIETMYAFMEKPLVDAGDTVPRGAEIGSCMSTELYYEYRLDGKSVLPGTGAEN